MQTPIRAQAGMTIRNIAGKLADTSWLGPASARRCGRYAQPWLELSPIPLTSTATTSPSAISTRIASPDGGSSFNEALIKKLPPCGGNCAPMETRTPVLALKGPRANRYTMGAGSVFTLVGTIPFWVLYPYGHLSGRILPSPAIPVKANARYLFSPRPARADRPAGG
jgi:hypothetical protein